jgi:hypothetical protein
VSVAVVSSVTPWSCGLACLESLASERGVGFAQASFIGQQRARFPDWQTMPGITKLDLSKLGGAWVLRWDVYDIAREFGLAGSLTEFKTRPPMEAFLQRPGNAVFALLKRYQEEGDSRTHAHAVRIAASQGQQLQIMDPGRQRPGRLVSLDWDVFRAWEPLVFGISPAA